MAEEERQKSFSEKFKTFFLNRREEHLHVPTKITEEQPRISGMKTYNGTQNFNLGLNSTTILFVQNSMY